MCNNAPPIPHPRLVRLAAWNTTKLVKVIGRGATSTITSSIASHSHFMITVVIVVVVVVVVVALYICQLLLLLRSFKSLPPDPVVVQTVAPATWGADQGIHGGSLAQSARRPPVL